jgi:membrane protease YdiL (CAAX protease family)
LIATLVATAFIFALVAVGGVLWMGRDAFQAFRHSLAARPLYYLGSRLIALAICVYFAKVRTRQDFLSGFALYPSTPRFLILAAMLGIWLAFFVQVVTPGGAARIRFQTHFSLGSIVLLIGPFLEEAVMRGFFYPAFRSATPLVVSILLVCAIDVLLFHFRTFWIPMALFGVGLVNIAACWLREHTKSLWPSIMLHFAYNIPFAVLASMG